MLIYELVDAIATLGGVHLQAGQPIAELVVGQCQVGTSPLAVVIALTTRVLGEGLGGARRTSVIRAGPALTVPSFACGRGGALANFLGGPPGTLRVVGARGEVRPSIRTQS